MPVQENEIALDTITLDKMGLPYELGQEITLQWRKDLNGEEITTSTFTLSGYWDGILLLWQVWHGFPKPLFKASVQVSTKWNSWQTGRY